MVLTALLPLLTVPFGQDEFPKEAWPFVGRWDLTIQTANGPRPAWLEIEPSGYFVVGRFVGAFGSARPVAALKIDRDTIRFELPRQWEKKDIVFEARLANGELRGSIDSEPRVSGLVRGHKAPLLKRDREPKWGTKRPLFNHRDLSGWKTVGKASRWSVQKGLLSNEGDGGNLVSEDHFEDFRLSAEFRYPKGSNSGLYLRGRYEVQIEDSFGLEPSRHGAGAIYGFFVPCLNAAKPAGEWQKLEVTLIGRMVTVRYNGQTIIDRQTIPGITGGALDSDEGNPGPLLIQGDHGPIEFRRLEIQLARP